MQILSFKKPISYWKQILRGNFTHLDSLVEFLELNEVQKQKLLIRPQFSLNLPARLAKKITKQTLDDPILKQFVPTQEETQFHPDFISDPVKDATFRKGGKLLHKYQGRVLLLCTSACAMHCRFCFRQNFDYETEDKMFAKELHLIKQDSSINEVILSGGDPLSLSDEMLGYLLQELAQMPHVKRIRFHTRFPIGIPERIDEQFLELISSINKQIWFVIHVNHPRELDDDVFSSLKQLQRFGCGLLSQSVLLKGINDDIQTLKQLFESLVDNGITPYYLHQLDRVQGAMHFEVEEETGLFLIEELAKQLPGYAVPKYVKEIAGQLSKNSLI